METGAGGEEGGGGAVRGAGVASILRFLVMEGVVGVEEGEIDGGGGLAWRVLLVVGRSRKGELLGGTARAVRVRGQRPCAGAALSRRQSRTPQALRGAHRVPKRARDHFLNRHASKSNPFRNTPSTANWRRAS